MLPLFLVAAVHAEAERVLFAGGCFWSVELAFQRVPGVIRTAVGYAGGHTLSPVTYQAVVTGTTGHAETVEVVYDPQRVSFERLVDLFWQLHDPTSLNQQGGDAGTQYRSAIWYTLEAQRVAVATSLARLPADVRRRVVTQISSATAKGFLWEVAEGYHRAPSPTPARHPCVRYLNHAPDCGWPKAQHLTLVGATVRRAIPAEGWAGSDDRLAQADPVRGTPTPTPTPPPRPGPPPPPPLVAAAAACPADPWRLPSADAGDAQGRRRGRVCRRCYGNRGPIKKMDKPGIRAILKGEL